MATDDNCVLPGQPQAQMSMAGTPKALGHPPKAAQPAASSATATRILPPNGAQGQIGYRPDMQSAATVTSRLQQNSMQL